MRQTIRMRIGACARRSPSPDRANRRGLPSLLLPAALASVALLAAACSSGPSSGSLGGKSASQILSLARAAATNADSFRFVDQAGTGTNETHLVGAMSSTEGIQVLSSSEGTLQVRIVGTTIYVQSSESALGSALDLSKAQAAKYAGKWISIVAGDAPYQRVRKALLPSSELDPYFPGSNLKVEKPTTLSGHSVLPVTGVATSEAGTTATATIFVSTSSPFVPVGGSLQSKGTGTSKSGLEVVAFSDWGQTIKVATPTNPVAFSTIKS
jgi:hypothetical protein